MTPDPKTDADTSRSSISAPSSQPGGNNNGLSSNNNDFTIKLPSVNLPKGGGAIKGIEEKFHVNSITGTSSLSIPLPLSPSRNGSTPPIELAYNSANGNSPFGIGWGLNVPSIKRKTDKGIPRYNDKEQSDTFILSSQEDLVPLLVLQGANWVPFTQPRTVNGNIYTVSRYRPRIDGKFSRIERWEQQGTTNVFWKTITQGNVQAFYGMDEFSRIQDPANPNKIFEWLLSYTYDDTGNIAIFNYKKEDFVNIPEETFEKNRRHNSTQRYLKKIFYGNKTPYYLGDALPANTDFLFQLVFDYGEHSSNENIPATITEEAAWPCRKDPFSNYRQGFEVRTYRRCKRVMMFHCFSEDLPQNPCLTKSLDLVYKEELELTTPGLAEPGFSFLVNARYNGHKWDPAQLFYTTQSLPELLIHYQQHEWNTNLIAASESSTLGMPSGLADKKYIWVDLFNEGIAGILTEQNDGWYYKSNNGNGEFSAPAALISMPSLTGLAKRTVFLQEIAGNGAKYLVQLGKDPKGFFRLQDDTAEWEPMKAFNSLPTIEPSNPNLRTFDVTGDGIADWVITEDQTIRWYAGLGENGFDLSEAVSKDIDEEKGPAIIFADQSSSIFLADMTGDGLTDIARIRNGETCYWPNLGYGRFGAKVTFKQSPVFDNNDAFNPAFIRLADLDGSGTTDLVYLGKNDCRVWLNQSGNEFSSQPVIVPLPPIHNLADIAVFDLLGSGTACIVYSTPLTGKPLWYIDLMQGKKPHLMTGYENNCGLVVSLTYKSSTQFYLEDKKQSRPWITHLPFPVHCIAETRTEDKIKNLVFTCSYRYSHGYFDQEEREFRGFGRVETLDTEEFSKFKLNDAKNVVEEPLHQAPVRSIAWFHTGAFLGNKKIIHQYQEEYFKNTQFAEYNMPDVILPTGLSVDQLVEACRACKGITLRTEVYADDGVPEHIYPFSATHANKEIKLLQPKGPNKYASFQVLDSEAISYNYERNPADPRIAHSFVLDVNEWGMPLATAAVVYKRVSRPSGTAAIPDKVWNEQSKMHIAHGTMAYTQDIVEDDIYRIRTSYETKAYELGGTDLPAGSFFTLAQIKEKINTATVVRFDEDFSGTLEKRLSAHSRNYYFKDDLRGPLPLGQLSKLAFGYKSYNLAFTQALVPKYYGTKVTEQMLIDAKYVHLEGDSDWWTQTGEIIFPANPRNTFYLPASAKDVYGNETSVEYDTYHLFVLKTTNAIGDFATSKYDYRTLTPVLVTDANLNRSAVQTDELGRVTRSAVMGKEGAGEGDTLDNPTTRIEYFVSNWKDNGKPNYVHSFQREKHGDPLTAWHESYNYFDGGGATVMAKMKAEPGKALKWNAATKTLDEIAADPRWIGNGRLIVNNKGNPVKKFDPYFSTTFEFEDEDALVESGFSSILYYDAIGRNTKIDNPNGSFSKVVLGAWQTMVYDVNDTVRDSQWYIDRGSPDPDAIPEPVDPETRAAWLAAKHYNTPGIIHTDALGRKFYAIYDYGGGKTTFTYSETDASGRYSKAFDQKGRNISESYTNLLGASIYATTAEKGKQWVFTDVAGRLVRMWDNDIIELYGKFDTLGRPVSSYYKQGGNEFLFSHIFYGDGLPDAVAKNLKGKAYLLFDQAGLVTAVNADFKGNVLTAKRRIISDHTQSPNWAPLADLTDLTAIMNAADPLLDDEEFSSSSNLDALNRPITVNLPDLSVIKPTYGVSNMLISLDIQLQGQGGFVNFLNKQDYDAKGQRQFVKYGNGLITNYFYDPKTFRLINLITKKDGDPDNNSLQNLFYTFDPAGNIVYTKDDAQQTHFFSNNVVKPESKFEYDAIYQLQKASGRELAGLGNSDSQRNNSDVPFINPLPHVNDVNAVRTYTEQYEYDDLGNITLMKHNAANANWVQRYKYEYEDDPNNTTNRLKSSNLPGDADGGPYTGLYMHDVRGNMTSMPHLSAAGSLVWNFSDQLTQVNLGGGGTAYYIYSAGGGRVKKVIERPGGKRTELLYLGVLEIYREFQNDAKRFERHTLQIADNSGRIAQVDTKVTDLDNVDAANPLNTNVIRYQYGNHLGSATMETNEVGDVISYEEYHPYGTSAYRSSNTAAGISLKRYRFSGKERDEETGFYYFGARYYAAWLGRWTSSDPAGLSSGMNLYRYCSNNPIMYVDPDGMQEVKEVKGSAALSDRKQEAAAKKELEKAYHIRITAMHFGTLPSGKEGWIADSFEDIGAGGGNGANGGTTQNASPQATPAPSTPATPPPAADASGSTGGGKSDPPRTEAGAATAAGGNVIRNNPVGETLTVPQTVTDAKLARLNEGAAQGELARNTGPGNSTTARRTAPAQRAALREFEDRVPPENPGDQAGHRIDLQYDRTNRMGNNWRDYIREDGPTNVNDGREGYRIMNNEHPTDGTIFGRAARPDTAGRFYNTPKFRSGARIAGGVLTAAGVGLSGYSLYHDIKEGDVPMGIGDSLGVVGGSLELYALGTAAYTGATVGEITVGGAALGGGLAALPLGIAVGGVGLVVVSAVSISRAREIGDTRGEVAGWVGVGAGTALAVGGGIAVASAAGIAMAPALIAAAPVLIAVGAVAALGVGVFHLGRHFHWWD